MSRPKTGSATRRGRRERDADAARAGSSPTTPATGARDAERERGRRHSARTQVPSGTRSGRSSASNANVGPDRPVAAGRPNGPVPPEPGAVLGAGAGPRRAGRSSVLSAPGRSGSAGGDEAAGEPEVAEQHDQRDRAAPANSPTCDAEARPEHARRSRRSGTRSRRSRGRCRRDEQDDERRSTMRISAEAEPADEVADARRPGAVVRAADRRAAPSAAGCRAPRLRRRARSGVGRLRGRRRRLVVRASVAGVVVVVGAVVVASSPSASSSSGSSSATGRRRSGRSRRAPSASARRRSSSRMNSSNRSPIAPQSRGRVGQAAPARSASQGSG